VLFGKGKKNVKKKWVDEPKGTRGKAGKKNTAGDIGTD